jgi:hypothetical protein
MPLFADQQRIARIAQSTVVIDSVTPLRWMNPVLQSLASGENPRFRHNRLLTSWDPKPRVLSALLTCLVPIRHRVFAVTREPLNFAPRVHFRSFEIAYKG